jgi:hypothetical protein
MAIAETIEGLEVDGAEPGHDGREVAGPLLRRQEQGLLAVGELEPRRLGANTRAPDLPAVGSEGAP